MREQHRDGADFVKAGMTTRVTFLAALREANRLGIRLGGHLPADLDPREAARGGVWSIEHLGPGVTVFAAVSSKEDEVRASNATRKLPPIPKIKIPGADRLATRLSRAWSRTPRPPRPSWKRTPTAWPTARTTSTGRKNWRRLIAYDHRPVDGPWPLARLARWASRNARWAPWAVVAGHEGPGRLGGPGTVRLLVTTDELPLLTEVHDDWRDHAEDTGPDPG
ncbi:hypothetical protein [Streptomyces sp. NPDC008125]|uniref:hypothetical protein n=1 Tax=Streptomyces sp. NPDC008125 TaxID=3364811 RepID=UPI0036E5BFCF